MTRKRVLIADDSAVFAEVMIELLQGCPGLDVVGVAADGAQAIEMTRQLRPDLVTMDVLMPGVDGLEAVGRIMATCPTPILVLSSDPRGSGGELAFEAVRRGALDCMRKPQAWPVPRQERDALVERIRLLASVPVVRHLQANRHRWRRRVTRAKTRTVDVVGIVASTGGPGALATVLGALDAAIPVPILVVQHLADGFCDGLRRWLGRACSLAVREAADGARLDPGTAHIAPVGWHLTVDARCRIELQDTPPVAGHRPSGTLMLRSLADAFGERALGVVLTGMGRDGAEGLLALYHAGAPTIAQDDETSVVGGMPGAARRLGAARQVLALTEIAAAITGAATGALSVTD